MENYDRGAELYASYLSGNTEAMAELVSLYKDNLIFFLCRYLPVFADAEDAAAEAFAALIVHPKRYDFKTSFKTYLFSIGKKKAIDIARKNQRRQKGDIPHDCSEEKSLLDIVLYNDEKKALHRAIGELSEDYRTALYLVYFEDMKISEAAVVMGKSKKQIENLLYRAKKSLKTALSEERSTNNENE